mgnify:CR=1 FL=1
MSPLLQPMTVFVTLSATEIFEDCNRLAERIEAQLREVSTIFGLNEQSKVIIDENTTYKKSNQIIPYQQYYGYFQPNVVPPADPNYRNFTRLWDSIIQINTSPTVKVIPANLYFAPDFSKYFQGRLQSDLTFRLVNRFRKK